MSHFVALAHRLSARSRSSLFLGLAATLLFSASAHAQFSAPSPGTQLHDTSALHPPSGARVAIVEFVDMECPVCGQDNPIVKAAAMHYKIPWIRRDFIIPYHAWSQQSAINARWFDTRSKALGDEYRDQVFANQETIYNLSVLHLFTDHFAADHHIALPFAIDPQGTLAAAVQADSDLGKRMGINHTPTVFIVTSDSKGAPYIEVLHPEQDLYRIIDQALADTASAPKAEPAKAPVKKPATAPAKKPASQ